VPELPEVEVLRRQLDRTLPGRAIIAAEIKRPTMFVSPTGLPLEVVRGRTILGLRRRAKMLILDLSDGLALLFHLKLAGQLAHRRGDDVLAVGGHPVPAFDAPLPHRSSHGRFDLDDGSVLWLTDIRVFARVWLLPAAEVDALLRDRKLGLEPFDPAFTRAYLRQALQRHRTLPIKSALLEQTRFVGLGNIYADEALIAARLHPERAAGSLGDDEVGRLHGAIQAVLSYAVEHGPADLPRGRVRDGAEFPRAHGRAGLPCLTCGAELRRIKVGARSTDFCPSCQPAAS
jgi:formamidopyrimidine-DNA glycosylase